MQLQNESRALAESLSREVRGEVRADLMSRVEYATDASIYKILPLAVLIAGSAEDSAAAVEAAREHSSSVTPRGAGTSLAGQAVGPGLQLDLSRLDRILELDTGSRLARVEPGVVQAELNAALEEHGLLFGPDTATANRATLGGMIGNNSAGMRSLLYGKTADHVHEVRCTLSDGSKATFGPLSPEEARRKATGRTLEAAIYRKVLEVLEREREEIEARFPKLHRRVSGYDLPGVVAGNGQINLARLIVGSEGTLALVDDAVISLDELPEARGLVVLHFDTLEAVAEAIVPVLKLEPSAAELLDRMLLQRTSRFPAYRKLMSFVHGMPEALLMVEFSGPQQEVRAKLEDLARHAERYGGRDPVLLRTPAEQQRAWDLRKAGLPLLMSEPGDAQPVAFVEDAAVAPERLPDFIREFTRIVERAGTTASYYGHAGAGCLHTRPVINLKTGAGVEMMRRIAEEVAETLVEFGGSVSGEHGDGLARSQFLEKMFGPRITQAFAEIKAAFDPHNVMNPGKIVSPEPMHENLRYGPDYRTLRLETHLDFSDQGGFARAVELCNGSGVCRKRIAGTMCPSYMVTAREEDTTRARANALRSVLDGTLPPAELTGERLYEVMDLCIGCKACKTECPSAVDVAKMKTEFLAHYREKNGYPLRSRFFGHVRRLYELGERFTPLMNLAGRLPLSGRLAAWIGITPHRRLPALAHRSLSARLRERRPRTGGAPVVLFDDTFTEYLYPWIGESAIDVLEAAGAQVLVPKVACCGRPMLSQGMVDAARRSARKNVDVLHPLVRRGYPLVGLEPSCILTIKDDYPSLLPDDERVPELVEACRLFEETVLELDAPEFDPGNPVLLHGHCHQKSLVGVEPTVRALSLVPETEVSVVDSGCCGMAGAFGYEKEHYEVSMQMAERRLLPAVREAGTHTLIVAPGTSCRQQISDGSTRRAIHPAEYLALHLRS
ncbi:FAD-binding oxidoreductase [Rubrobacter taiwanensis]|jgi:FAD/FMN-containing dehydrogenase/Fe-S oxidoreductase|uniref:FAD-binding oxidoreductase n=1 Tax=Rubrobacter taiwanensis TaxID=185139 RepID=A0A4R1BM61_9ACTN|nr:FAD-binding and (Fe-S)-binding domain-containing protein [Rubrobacter taiwanensis]TCJ18427.1 FAD-binding oxidoreductase [Rubrobacter taiwanensis]